MSRNTRTRSLAAAAAPLLATVMILGGCGADDTSSSETPATTPTGPPQISEELRKCLEDQGVELPTEQPTDGNLPTMDSQMQEALQACASLAPGSGPGSAGGPGEIDQSALDAFAGCMTDNGVQVNATLEAVTALDQSKEKVSKALATCAPLLQP